MTFNAEVAEVKNAEENGESLCVLCVFSSPRTLQLKKMVNRWLKERRLGTNGKRRVAVSRDSPLVPAWRQKHCGFQSSLSGDPVVRCGSIKVSVFGWSIFEVERRGQSRWLLGVQSKVEVYLSGWHVEQCEIDRTGF